MSFPLERTNIMAINLESLSPTELKALINHAESQIQTARANQVATVRTKIDALLKSNNLTIADVYPTRGGKSAKGVRAPVAPKYRNPADPSQTWSGRGKRPLWFVAALKKRGVTADSLLIDQSQAAPAPAAAKKAPAKATRKAGAKKSAARKNAKKA